MSDANQLFHQARQAFAKRDYAQSVALCAQLRKAIGLREEIANLQAMSLLAMGQVVEAETVMLEALKQDAVAPGVLLNAARIDLRMAEPQRAKRHTLEAARRASNDSAVLYQAAMTCRQLGDETTAFRLLERCLHINPSLADGWHLKGSMLLDQGAQEQARAALEQALALLPTHGKSLADLAQLSEQDQDQDQLEQRLLQAATGSVDPWDRSSALFALARRAHKQQDYERAGTFYLQANALGKSLRPYAFNRWMEKQAATLEREQALTAIGPPGQGAGATLTFIVGMPRSGTSLTEQVLSQSPQVLACGELTAMHALEINARPGAGPEQQRKRYLNALPKGHERYARVVDKLPMNFERVGMIHRLFPGARFVHCERSPLDTIWSCFQQDFQSGVHWAFDLEQITEVYLQHRQLMSLWKQRLPDHIFTLPYESLVTDLKRTIGDLCDFLDLAISQDMLAPHTSSRSVKTASRQQVRKAVYTSSVDKWRHYERLLAPAQAKLHAAGISDRRTKSTD